jgi:hypothetical protein
MQHNTNLLDHAESHFYHWRATRTKRGKIPDYHGKKSNYNTCQRITGFISTGQSKQVFQATGDA